MAPTIKSPLAIKKEIKSPSTVKKEENDTQINNTNKSSELLLKVRYNNSLPDFPFDLKFIKHPFSSTRFVEYKPTSLEQEFKHELLNEPDLGIEIDLVDQDRFVSNCNGQLESADEKIIEEEMFMPQDTTRSKHHAKSVSWLRRTEYISTEQTRFQSQTVEKVEAKVGYNVKKTLAEGILYMDRSSQISAIKKTFEDCKKPIEVHHSKPNVVPIEILPVFPDFELWKYPCAQVIFETDPAPPGRSISAQIEEMSQALIRGVKDESGEQFVAYFLPTQETLEKRRKDVKAGVNYMSDEEYDYKISREYNWTVRSKATKASYEENYFFVIRKDGVYYNELETRVRLVKRRLKANQVANNTRLIVKHRPLTSTESKMHRYREKQLEPAGYDESEQEEEVQLVQPQIQENENKDELESQRRSRSKSKSKSRSRSKSSSTSRSGSKSKSRSRSRSNSSSRSRSKSKSRSRSGSNSTSRSRSKSKSRSRSRSNSSSRSRSKSKSRSRSTSNSTSRSRSKSKSRSRSTSRSRSKSKSRSQSRSNSRSRSRSRSKSRSRSYSRSSSNSRYNSSRSRSGSKSSNKSRSPSTE
ncbi:RNA polymerase II-associated factor 1 homolog [Leptopilina boulardi]|uniref:RNA polymerase II-associated factor 1 homolog n=1 Tax=Leptopilina boulardi TaxID=63433 RepID=UPI0021F6201C|nr:RNA polymerase II-associated factor 1 homolog [Leptopilina boulardi]